jgi:hypothetical protein
LFSFFISEGAFGVKVVGFLFPYTHFLTIWSNFLGYTGMPDRRFEFQHASMSPEELAIASLPVPPNEANSKGTSLYPQGSTFSVQTFYSDDYYYYEDVGKDNCPAQNASEYFCPSISQCASALNPAPTPSSPSLNQMIGYLLALSSLYTLVAAYWAQVFPGSVCMVVLFLPSTENTIISHFAEWSAAKVLLFLASELLVRIAHQGIKGIQDQ